MSEPVSRSHQLRNIDQRLALELAATRLQLETAENAVRRLRDTLDAAADRERLLASELEHRVKTMLSTLRTIYRRSRSGGASPDEFAEHFGGRLNAVARYYSAAAGSASASMDLEEVVRSELLDVHCTDETHVTVAGPPVQLCGRSGELMGLAIHELTTNAIKFGALQLPGTLHVDWSLAVTPTQRNLQFRWMEKGVRVLSVAPRARGFGRQLIEETLPIELGAHTSFEFRPGGVECSIILPVIEPREKLYEMEPTFVA